MSIFEIPIVIDGPNYINRIQEMSINKNIISRQLSFTNFREALIKLLRDNNINAELSKIEFVCSKKLFGSGDQKFTQEERDVLLQRIMRENGVHIEEVNLPGSSEKGVDTMISTKIETFSDNFKYIILITNDRDFVPLLVKMREKGINVILVSITNNTPVELVNECYLTIELSKEYECLFKYEYLHFPIYESFDIEKFRRIIAEADDRVNNQLRVSQTGFVYLSKDKVGAEDIRLLQFRYETFTAGNGYVGPKPASDDQYIKREYEELMLAWKHKDRVPSYIDVPIEVYIKDSK